MFEKNYIINVLEYIRGAINIGESSDNLIKYIDRIEKNLDDKEKEYWRKKEENMLEEQVEEKHLKGYIFDSLVYRYQLALYKASLKDAEDIMMRKNISRKDAETEARFNYNRDMMRFCEILNEAIGDHD